MSPVQSPTLDSLTALFDAQKARSLRLRVQPLTERKKLLRDFEKYFAAQRGRIQQAVFADFGKPATEVDMSEVYPVLTELRHTLAHLEEWAAPEDVDTPMTYLGSSSEVRYEPKGVCLIISPWNFPVNICFGPLVSALAAGNTVFIKPSEYTPNTSRLIRDMVAEFFDDDLVTVVEGGVDQTRELLKLPFDHIFFTGSPQVGKVVMRAAAENLTSVTLELGGKSPTIIDETANLRDAARRVAFGKFLNNGQTCIAPDHIWVHESVAEEWQQLLVAEVRKLFGEGGTISEKSPSYGRVVSDKHFRRLHEMVEDAIQRGAKILLTGEHNAATRFMHPVVLTQVPPDARLMEEEVFGPVLPVLSYQNLDDVIRHINAWPKPLALYVFSSSKSNQEKVLHFTSSGSVCVNDCITQYTHPNLPFGGVNNSGIGKAHGRYSFVAFSNEKPVLRQKRGFAMPYLLHPPYTESVKRSVNLMLKWF
jgi:aldehyde dehydrogenase (NAD+)